MPKFQILTDRFKHVISVIPLLSLFLSNQVVRDPLYYVARPPYFPYFNKIIRNYTYEFVRMFQEKKRRKKPRSPLSWIPLSKQYTSILTKETPTLDDYSIQHVQKKCQQCNSFRGNTGWFIISFVKPMQWKIQQRNCRNIFPLFQLIDFEA